MVALNKTFASKIDRTPLSSVYRAKKREDGGRRGKNKGGLYSYYISKIEELEIANRDKAQNLERLKAQRNEINSRVRLMREN